MTVGCAGPRHPDGALNGRGGLTGAIEQEGPSLDFPDILYSASTWIVPILIAITFHEAAHAYAAWKLGDDTAFRLGRVTFNPLRHIDPFGTILLPALLFLTNAPFLFGWAKPVPVVAARMRNPRLHMMLVALAGPGMNLLLALLAAIAIGIAAPAGGAFDSTLFWVKTLENFIVINIFLAVFNLLPVPPFDGGHVVEGLLPRPLARRYAKLGRFGFPILIFLLLILPMLWPQANVIQRLVVPPVRALLRLYGSVGGWA